MSHTQEKSNRNVHDQDVQLAAATLVSYFTVEFLSGGESEHVGCRRHHFFSRHALISLTKIVPAMRSDAAMDKAQAFYNPTPSVKKNKI